ncbi:ATP-binding cassette domain-containing protein [Rhodococcus rhodnii]|uniref:Bifunctional ABC multidrug transporter n=1 Tax=Rhodococcus rhodnii LMG 5362 TaxID=1273125 RepID=R7WI44_9NOCA|nr:ATP-binding cassette domain-containing protein [Rhodococcus rhodnii]EOM74838.1 bifunctional ABC multidrug transporter [Rhodococcus rhodnii LMG 5362]
MVVAAELWRAAFTHPRHAFVTVGTHLAVASTHALGALALAVALSGIATRHSATIAAGLAAVLGLALVRAAFGEVEANAAGRLGATVAGTLRDRALAATAVPTRLHDVSARDGRTLTTLVDGVDGVDAYVTRYLPVAVTVVVVTPAVLVAVAVLSPLAGAAAFVGVALALAGPMAWRRAMRSREPRHWDSYERLAADLLDALRSMATVRALGATRDLRDSLGARSDALHRATVGAMRISLVDTAIVDLAVQGGYVVAVALAATGAGDSHPLALYAVLLLASEAFRPVRDLAREWHAGFLGMSALPGLRAAGAFDPVAEPAAPQQPGATRGARLAFSGVRFRYPDAAEDVLGGVDLDLRPGALHALTGESGAGKSTLLDLALGHLTPTSGTVLVGDTAPEAGCLAVVSQHPVLFHGTVRANLAAGAHAPSDTDLRRAAAAAGARDVVAALGLDGMIAEAGSSLSGGQRQRLAVARALASDRPALLADEPTSALDDGNARRVLAALRDAARDRVVVVVTHRIDLLEPEDEVLRLTGGCVVTECREAAR